MRTKLLAGNWKMNKLNADLPAFFKAFGEATAARRCDVLFAVPFPLLPQATELAAPYRIKIAAQNFHAEPSGAFTGEVSLAMLKELGVTSALVGHSERRQYFNETDASVAAKTKAALAQGVSPIACVGETLAEREANATAAVVARQLQAILDALPGYKPAAGTPELVIAYEPVWAIGTGRSATSLQAQEVHKLIRGLLAERYGQATAGAMRILYGGSASPANIDELLKQGDIDGGLVGGASLKPEDFAKMVLAC